jgi:hypothetical protein
MNFGRAMLEGSRALQDFQAAGVLGIQNNIEGLATAMGLGAGAAGALTVAMLALPPLFSKLWDVLRDDGPKLFANRLEEVKARIEELDGKKIKIAADTQELDRLKEELKELEAAAENFKSLTTGQNKAERESGQRFREKVIEAPGAQEALAALREQVGQDARAALEKEVTRAQEAVDREKALLAIRASNSQQVARVEKDLEDAKARQAAAGSKAQEAMEKLLLNAEKKGGREQAAAQEELRRRFGRVGTGAAQQLAGEMGAFTPQALVAQEARKAAADQLAAQRKEADRLAQERAREAEKATQKAQQQAKQAEDAKAALPRAQFNMDQTLREIAGLGGEQAQERQKLQADLQKNLIDRAQLEQQTQQRLAQASDPREMAQVWTDANQRWAAMTQKIMEDQRSLGNLASAFGARLQELEIQQAENRRRFESLTNTARQDMKSNQAIGPR